jgi:8-amino-7-oxononanoate synthase
MIASRIAAGLAELDSTHSRRRRRLVDTPVGPHTVVDGRAMLAFCSNDYLGLANHPDLVAALCEGAHRWGAGSGASHLVSGHLRPHEELEQKLAAFVGLPRALCFSAGYLANLGVVPALVGCGDAVFSDRLNHASLIDAAIASRAEHHRYPHCDTEALQRALAASNAPGKLIVSDAVFSMDGDLAPLPRLLELAEAHDAWLMVDDAHGFGVLGCNGRGSLSHFGLPPSPWLVYVGTFGKAAGVAGAFVGGSELAIEWLLQRARSYIFTTAPPPALAVAVSKSIELIAAGDDHREHLRQLIERLRDGLADLAAERAWRLLESSTPIQALVIGDNRAALDLAAALEARGIWVPAIRPPTVPQGTARLRITLSAAHREEDIDSLLTALREAR